MCQHNDNSCTELLFWIKSSSVLVLQLPMFESLILLCVFPPTNAPQSGLAQSVAQQRRWLQGTGWTELSCVCLSTLAVQNILSPVQQAQTGSRMTTQPEGQPPVGPRSDSPEHLQHQLQPRVALDLRRPVSHQAQSQSSTAVKYNKTHCWNSYCASYSTLFLVVLMSSLTAGLICPQPRSVLPFASQASLHSCCTKLPDIPAHHRSSSLCGKFIL